ncbi:hypothetical protein K7X08_014910 [Anisodus acutangulus]|uniref:UNC93-like protein 3 n=1 Tax=Anisodus acutangulus TaxID=402998 RepID=A0A9Q1LMQ8_9SOLA|nr:hypothetical protein K7X08_014910 [Anisodus acutangulus]
MVTDEETPLVVENSKNGNPINLESTINTEGNLGTISLGILYLSFMLCSIFASLVVRKLGSKNALILGITGYWLFVAANLMPNWYTMVPASLYLGFAASIIWVGQGTYLTSTAHSHANDHSLNEAVIIGKFNGVFWGMFALHQFVGNLITLALMRDGEGGSTSGTTVLFLVFVCTITLGAILMCFLSKRTGKEETGLQDSSASFVSSVATLFKSIITLLQDIRMLLVIPLTAYSGLQQAFVWAEFTKYIVKPTMGESGVGGAMAVYGFFDAICSLVAGHFTFGLLIYLDNCLGWSFSSGCCIGMDSTDSQCDWWSSRHTISTFNCSLVGHR